MSEYSNEQLGVLKAIKIFPAVYQVSGKMLLLGKKKIMVGAQPRHSWVNCSPRLLDILNHEVFKYFLALSFSPHCILNIYSMASYLQVAGELLCEV